STASVKTESAMKMFTVCMKCFEENIVDPPQVFAEYVDGGFLAFTCPNGHDVISTVQAHRFELLFDLGALAFIDGYYREAVATTATAMERFLEFCLRVYAIHHEIPDSEFDEAWKRLAKQSERQLGAFLMTYLFQNKVRCLLLDDKWAELRNRVVHQ